MRQRIYIAGPISKGPLLANLNQARGAGDRLLKAGFAPFVPHLTCYWSGDTPEVLPSGTKNTDWYDVDLPWVAVSDAVLRLPGESVGADMEVALAEELGIPVYYEVSDLIENPPAKGHPGFHKLLKQMSLLHNKKSADYGTEEDPFENVRASEESGVAAWKAAWIRAHDKVVRIKQFCRRGSLENESLIDSFMDLAAYCLIARLMYDEASRAKELALA